MLDEDDRNRKPLIPLFLKSCAGWGLALLLVGTALWFIVKPQKWWSDRNTGVQTEKQQHNKLQPDGTNGSVPVENTDQDPHNKATAKLKEPATKPGNIPATNAA